jgi:uncharacterized membrane protein
LNGDGHASRIIGFSDLNAWHRHLADKYGRKLIVLSGLMSGALGTFLFGLSPNFTLAFISRLFAGALSNSSIYHHQAAC